MRNRIIHSLQITAEDGTQVLATKVKKAHEQFRITEDYLVSFLKQNEELSDLLHEYRGYQPPASQMCPARITPAERLF